jgi:biotin transport system substrate-specific component
MSETGYIAKYRELRLRAFERFGSLAFAHKAAIAFGFAILTAMAAQLRIYTPFSPVPFTLQVFPVLLAGAFLGKYYGGASLLIYLSMGLAGLPVFAVGHGGYAVLLGPTAGYLVGFVFAAFLIGHLVHSGKNARSTPRIAVAMTAGIAVIYLFGAGYLAILLGLSIEKAFVMGVLPFIGFDLLKMAGAAGMARAALPGDS